MNKFLLCSIVLIIGFQAQAQVDPLYAQYLTNPLTINPAYTGLNNNLNMSVAYRRQWAGFDGSPTTANVSAHTSLKKDRMGVGVIFVSDRIGSNNNTEAHVSYSYKVATGKSTFSFGLQAGFINFKSNNTELNPFDPADPAFATDINITRPSFGTGVILKSERYFIGFSVPRLLANSIDIAGIETELYSQHYYLMGAYVFNLSERIRLKPSVLLKGVKGSPLSVDYNASFNLDEKYTIGLFARNLNTCGLLAQIRFAEAYRLAYTFETPLNNSVESRFTTHELSFGVNLSVFSFQSSTVTNF
jgi:type IX secretion system PorP/SprF family membrane protein